MTAAGDGCAAWTRTEATQQCSHPPHPPIDDLTTHAPHAHHDGRPRARPTKPRPGQLPLLLCILYVQQPHPGSVPEAAQQPAPHPCLLSRLHQRCPWSPHTALQQQLAATAALTGQPQDKRAGMAALVDVSTGMAQYMCQDQPRHVTLQRSGMQTLSAAAPCRIGQGCPLRATPATTPSPGACARGSAPAPRRATTPPRRHPP